ncbi:hypothetical protein B9Z55_009181 [Caenorhabditis nigoni]|uniref:BTB domain-containing protein n=1 Tax=Caenorhabditis nigoni TaxID=1611254 RepID=A0A2G5UQV4_9PELO|nr:hypothetical protein B9Z55_009181 [Caenorhabditis nigoni]
MKEFVIRHVFNRHSWHEDQIGPTEIRYNVPWHLQAYQKKYSTQFLLVCDLKNGPPGWSIDTDYEVKLVGKKKSFLVKEYFTKFDEDNSYTCHSANYLTITSYSSKGGEFKVEYHVKIKKMVGFENSQDSGDSEDKENDSEVDLVVGKEKFKVDKKLLADNCTYFNALFFETPEECGKSEIEINDSWNTKDFNDFLKILKSEQDIDEKSINGVLDLSSKFGSNSMLTKCEKFLIQKSKKSIKIKFDAAIKYELNELKEKCLSDIKTNKDLVGIASEKAGHFNASVWKELLQKSITIN